MRQSAASREHLRNLKTIKVTKLLTEVIVAEDGVSQRLADQVDVLLGVANKENSLQMQQFLLRDIVDSVDEENFFLEDLSLKKYCNCKFLIAESYYHSRVHCILRPHFAERCCFERFRLDRCLDFTSLQLFPSRDPRS